MAQEVIVIDNASHDGSVEMLSSDFPDCKLMKLKTNIGYGSAVNIAVQEAKGQFLLLLNPDVEVNAHSIDSLVRLARAHPDAGVVSPRLVYADGQPQPSARRFLSPFLLLFECSRLHLCLPRAVRGRLLLGTYFPQDRTMEVPWVSGACHLIPISVWKKVGPLTEETFCGSDDYDYCYRVRQLGYKVWLCSESTMIHHCSVAVRKRWSPWEVEQVAAHNFYVVLEAHWPRWRVRAYNAAEIVSCLTEMVRNRLWPRMQDYLASEEYRERLVLRLRMQLDLFWGRVKPERRCQPIGRLSQTSVSEVASQRG
jgi:GT2 family glycosyltransferase